MKVHDIYTELVNSRTLNDAVTLLSMSRSVFGYSVVGYREEESVPLFQSRPATFDLIGNMCGWPAEFLEKWNGNGSDRGIAIGRDSRKAAPITAWTLPSPKTPDPGSSAIMMMERFALSEGVTIRTRSAGGSLSCVSWIRQRRHGCQPALPRSASDMTLLAAAFTLALDNLQSPACEAAELTPKERECLEWVAAGKTDKEIGLILQRSPQTVRFHLRAIFAKLGVVNRAQAAAVSARHLLAS